VKAEGVMSASAAASGRAHPVILVSHGFQTNYERGFANAAASLPVHVTLISSDRTDVEHLSPKVRAVNLRGSQEEGRSRHAKAINQLRYLLRLVGYVARHREATVHVIGLIEPPALFGIGLGLMFRLLARRYVLTVHNLLPHDRHTGAQRRWFGWAFRLPHRLVVHTPSMGERLVTEFGIPRDRIVHMEHGIEPLDPRPDAAASHDLPAPSVPGEGVNAGTHLGANAGAVADARHQPPLRLLFFGVLKRYKGLDLLLDALEDLGRPFVLDIHGISTSEGLTAEIQQRLDTHPHRGSIHWHRGFVPEGDVPAMFARADALVLPYRAIDQSGVLFQAFRFGVPVIASRVGSFGDYVVPAVGELCAPEDAIDLRRALKRLDARRGELGAERIRAHGRRYEWPVTVRALAPVYGG